jgi:NAD dependent epimerase/dehydratase family enzyme
MLLCSYALFMGRKPMRAVITGATGLIGRALCEKLCRDYEIIALSRNPEKSRLGQNVTVVQWDAKSQGEWARHIDGAYGVINLAGESIASGRWTPVKKQRILESRLNATNAIVEAISSAKQKPQVLIQASAIGFYGKSHQSSMPPEAWMREKLLSGKSFHFHFEFSTESSTKGNGFLADVCEQWEQAAKPVEAVGTRLVIIRTGTVLSRDGGALPHMIKPFKIFLGGYPGSGQQWISWITIDDEVSAIRFLLENQGLSGSFNLIAPSTLTMKFFCQTIGRALKRPCWLKISALVLLTVLGKMADETILADQRVIPHRLLKAGFTFEHPNLTEALEHVLGKGKK